MDSPEFKPFELKDFDSEVSVQEAAAVETDGFKPMNYSAGEDYAVLGEVDEKTETEKKSIFLRTSIQIISSVKTAC